MKKIYFFLLILFAAGIVFAHAAKRIGPEFSAVQVLTAKHLVPHHGPTTYRTKVYVNLRAGKIRLESTPAESDAPKKLVQLLDISSSKGYVLRPDKKTYTDMGPVAYSALARDVMAVKGICEDYSERYKGVKGGATVQCRVLGSDPVNGYNAVKYEVDVKEKWGHTKTTLWVDPATKIYLKLKEEELNWVLTSIKEGPQPASLFEIPPGYRKK